MFEKNKTKKSGGKHFIYRMLAVTLSVLMCVTFLPGVTVESHATEYKTGTVYNSQVKVDDVIYTGVTFSNTWYAYTDKTTAKNATYGTGAYNSGRGNALPSTTSGKWIVAAMPDPYTINIYPAPAGYDVNISISSGMHMSRTGGGNLSQSLVNGAMSPITITADTGYEFPSDYASKTSNGVTVSRTSDTTLTVSGTPTAAASISISTAASPKKYSLTLSYDDKTINSVSASGTGVTETGTGIYDVKYDSNITITAEPKGAVDKGDGVSSGYKFYRWVNNNATYLITGKTEAVPATYAFTWKETEGLTLKAEGIGGIRANGNISVLFSQLADPKTATVNLSYSGGELGNRSVVLKSGEDVVNLEKGSGDSYSATFPPENGLTYTIWVDGIETSQTLVPDGTQTVNLEKFDCEVKLDGEAYDGHIVELKKDGISYPAGSILPSGVTYERYVDGVKYDDITVNKDTDFYSVTFKDNVTDGNEYGDTTPYKKQFILSGQKAVIPTTVPDYTCEGDKSFEFWQKSGTTGEFSFDTPITSTTVIDATWQDNSVFEAKWIINGENYYGSLRDALARANHSGDYIYLQKNASISGGTLATGVTLNMSTDGMVITNSGTFVNNGTINNNGSITGNITNTGTIKNVVVSNIANSGKLGSVTNSGNITNGTLASLSNSGTARNLTITGTTSSTGTIDGCRIGAGTGIGGTITGSNYAGNGVTFATGTTFDAATISIQGGGTIANATTDANAAANFAGIADVRTEGDDTYIKPKANIVLRAAITFKADAVLELDNTVLKGENGSEGTTGGSDGITPIKVEDKVLEIKGTGQIIGGNGGDSTGNGDGGNGGDGIHSAGGSASTYGGSVVIDGNITVAGGTGGTGNGNANEGGKGGNGVTGSSDRGDFVIINGTAQGGNGGPAIGGANGGAGGNGLGDKGTGAPIIFESTGNIMPGQPGEGRFEDPVAETGGGTTNTTTSAGMTATSFTFTLERDMKNMKTVQDPSNTQYHIGQNYEVTLSGEPEGNQYIILPDNLKATMGGRTLESGTDYTYDTTTKKFKILVVPTANVKITATATIPASVVIDTNDNSKIADALALPGIKNITISGAAVTLSSDAELGEGRALYVNSGAALTIANGKKITNKGFVIVNGALSGNITDVDSGMKLVKPVPAISSDGDYITGLTEGKTYKVNGNVITAGTGGKLFIQDAWRETEVVIAQTAAGYTTDSATITVPAAPADRPAAPTGFTVTQPTAPAEPVTDGSKGSVAGITSAYQYSEDYGMTWHTGNYVPGTPAVTEGDVVVTPAVPATGILGNLAQGSQVWVRVPAQGTTPAGMITVLNINVYSQGSGSHSGGGNRPAVVPGTTAADPIIVDGKSYDIGTQTVTETSTTVTVDQTKLDEQIKGANNSVIIPVNNVTDTVSAQLVIKNVEDMAVKNMTLTVKTNGVNYEMPASAIDAEAVMKALGASKPEDVPVTITISKSEEAAAAKITAALKSLGAEIVISPVEFEVKAAYGGKTVAIDKFDKYVARFIEVTEDQAKKITTAIVYEPNGTVRHVPTNVHKENGKWFAEVNSRTNSTYALVYNEASFADASGKWYEDVVNEMASRKVVKGRATDTFDGGASVTRAEFASILINALGLPADGNSSFSDVKSTSWYAGAVGAAYEYGLVSGRGDNKFDPGANITRQEAMAMIQRAAEIAEFAGISGEIGEFMDADAVKSWAKSAAQFNVGSGLIKGENGWLNPGKNITRAESAAIILRLLQKAELVDVRTQA